MSKNFTRLSTLGSLGNRKHPGRALHVHHAFNSFSKHDHTLICCHSTDMLDSLPSVAETFNTARRMIEALNVRQNL